MIFFFRLLIKSLRTGSDGVGEKKKSSKINSLDLQEAVLHFKVLKYLT